MRIVRSKVLVALAVALTACASLLSLDEVTYSGAEDGGSSTPDVVSIVDASDAGACDMDALATDPRNCGRCGHACSGKCVDGLCEPTPIATGLNFPQHLAVGTQGIYWTSGLDDQVLRCPKAGCPDAGPTVLIRGLRAQAIALDEPEVFAAGMIGFGGVFGVLTCDAGTECRDASAVYAQIGGDVQALALADRTLYLGMRYPGGKPALATCPTSGCPDAAPIWDGGDYVPYRLAVDQDGELVWAGDLVSSWIVQGCALPDCADPRLVATGADGPIVTGLAVTKGRVFWAIRETHHVFSCSKLITGCGDAATVFVQDAGAVGSVVSDGAFLYWPSGELKGRILRCPVDKTCDVPEVLAKDQDDPFDVALDERYVYWSNVAKGSPNAGSIMRVER